ncbi:MAG: BrnA antitoxin family protein [Gammaproteobacteria bacterium]|nr:BrnA antitoxin family protein [Gammaproteobacteria bacterium]
MRKEYDLNTLEIKRRGVLPGLEASGERQPKVRITITLDKDIVDYFKAEAKKSGALPYQTQINQALHQAMKLETEGVKQALLKDPDFIRAVANEINQR